MIRSTTLFAVVFCTLTPLNAAGIVYFFDDFNTHPEGHLAGQGRWQQLPDFGDELPIQVADGRISLNRSGAAEGVVARFFDDTVITSGITYFGFDFTVAAAPDNDDGFPDFFAFLASNSPIGASAVLYAKAEDEGQKFSLGFGHTVSDEITFGGELLLNVPYRAIVRYTNVPGALNDVTDVFVSPLASPFSLDENDLAPYLTDDFLTGTSIITGLPFPEFNQFSGIGFRQSDPNIAALFSAIDNVIVSNNYLAVVPEPASALSMLGGGILLLGRRGRR